MFRQSRRTVARLFAVLLTGGLVAAACSESSTLDHETVLEPLTVNQLVTKWSDTFASATQEGPVAIVAAAKDYLATTTIAEAEQVADEINADVFTHAGMREALVNGLNQTGRFDEALQEIAKLDGQIVPSRLALLRAMSKARVDVRAGVVEKDPAKRDALLVELAANEPAEADAWSAEYSYNLATGLFIAGRTDEALPRFLSLLGSEADQGNLPLSLDTIGSALNMTVTALRAEGRMDEAQAMVERLIRFDDAHHLNYAGRFGVDTNPNDVH